MMRRSKLLGGLAAAVLVGGVLFATPAAAIQRTDCNDAAGPLNVYSDHTTCWRDAGTASVVLYNTVGGHSGNYTGRVSSSGFYRTFTYHGQTISWNLVIVTSVQIY